MERSGEHGSSQPSPDYTLNPQPYRKEDILFCLDIDVETKVEMKVSPKSSGPITRLESIKQAAMMFVYSKLTIDSDHRFSFSTLGKDHIWERRVFSNHVVDAVSALQTIKSSDSSYGRADLTLLFQKAAYEAKKSKQQDRIFRVILIYCRSATRPEHRYPVNPKNFTLDIVYLHDKPSTENCPQRVYDKLVDALEHVSEHEAYILETGQMLNRIVARHLLTLLCHPQQRCTQDDIDFPKSLIRKPPPNIELAVVAVTEESSTAPA